MWAEACKKASLKDPPCSWFIVTHTLKCFTVTWPQRLQCFLSVSPHQARAQTAKTVQILSGGQPFGLKLDQRHSTLCPQTGFLSSFFNTSFVSNIIKSCTKKLPVIIIPFDFLIDVTSKFCAVFTFKSVQEWVRPDGSGFSCMSICLDVP